MGVPAVTPLMSDDGRIVVPARSEAANGPAMPLVSLRRNFCWTFVGNMVYAGCCWGMLVVLAKLGSPEMVGQFGLGLAITAPVMLFAGLQLRAVLATDANGEYVFGDYLSLTLINTGLALIAITGFVVAAGYRWETALVTLAIGVGKGFDTISQTYYGLFQKHERMDPIAKTMMLNGVLSLVALGVAVYFTGSVFWGAVGSAAASAAALAASVAWCRSLLPRDYREAEWGERQTARSSLGRLLGLAYLSLPLGFVMMMVALNTNIPRYFLELYQGERKLGIFVAMAYLMVAGNTVVDALGQSATPRLARYYAAGDTAAFRGLLHRLIGLGVLAATAGVAVVWIFGRIIITLLYTPEYAIYQEVLLWLTFAAGIGFVSSFLGYGMTAARYFRTQTLLSGAVAVIITVAGSLLIAQQGLAGAALALVVGASCRLIGGAWVITHAIRHLPTRRGLPCHESQIPE